MEPIQKPKPAVQGNGNGDQPIDSVPLYGSKKISTPLVVVLGLIVLLFIGWLFTTTHVISSDDAYVDANKVTISSKYTGKVAQVLVDEGVHVKKAQVLAVLDASDLDAQKEQAKAALVFAEKNKDLAKVNYEKALEDFNRAKVQYTGGIIPKEDYDHVQKSLEAARVQKDIAAAQIHTAQAQLGVIQTQLGNITITAPMDGVIAKRWVLPGDVVQVAQPMLTLIDDSHLWIVANLEETKFSKLHLGQTVTVAIDTYHGKKFKGTITELGSNTASQFSLIPPNNAAGNYTKITQRIPIKITLVDKPATDQPLLPGMSAVITIKGK